MRSYEAAGGIRFWEHDVRALAGTRVREAMENDAAQKVLAHSDPKQTMNYTDRRMKVKVTPLKRRT
jgi:integrase